MLKKTAIKYITLIFLLLPAFFVYPLGFNGNELKGNKLYRTGNYEDAVKEYTEALSSKADYDLYYNRGASFFKLGQYEKALSDFEDSATYANSAAGQEKAIYNAGNSSFMQAETEKTKKPAAAIDAFGKAVKHFERVLELDSNNSDAAYNLELSRLRMDALKKLQDQQNKDKKQKNQQNKDQQNKDQQNRDQQQKKDQQDKDQQNKDQQQQDQQNNDHQSQNDNSKTASASENVSPRDILNEEARRKEAAQLLLSNGSAATVDKDW